MNEAALKEKIEQILKNRCSEVTTNEEMQRMQAEIERLKIQMERYEQSPASSWKYPCSDISETWDELVQRKSKSRIIYLIMDGAGGLPYGDGRGTALQVAATPNLDQLARESSCGLLEIIGPGITPGSGPGHLALFGYDPLKYKLGRGILSALGIDFELQTGDVAARANFATIDQEGKILDRRAGRINTDTNLDLCKRLRENVHLNFDGEFFIETVSEHRAVLILRSSNLGSRIKDTDPQMTGARPIEPEALSKDSKETSSIVRSFVDQTKEILSKEKKANMVLLRGFDQYKSFPSLKERFELESACVAEYPMYRGISRLLGMHVAPRPGDVQTSFLTLKDLYAEHYTFYFVHIKKTDSSGEDGDFDQKVKTIETVDGLMPLVVNLDPEVLVVTADHSTPALMKMHSWHPVPIMIRSKRARVDHVEAFDEYACAEGALGLRPGVHLIGLALAHADRLSKYGA